MPKIVNKEEKRKEIALKAYEYICKFGIKEFSTSSLINYMNVGKSSIYNYYSSKDEIFCEAYSIVTKEYFIKLKSDIKKATTFKDKLETYFRFYYIDIIENPNIKEFYKECMIMSLENKTKKVIETNEKFFKEANTLMLEIFEDEVKKGNISKKALLMVEFLQMNVDGIFISSFGVRDYNAEEKIKKYINNFIKLVEIEK